MIGTYLIVTAFISLLLILHIGASRRVTYLGWMLIFVILIYGIFEPFVLNAILRSPQRFIVSEHLHENLYAAEQRGLFIIVATLSLVFGWVAVSSANKSSNYHTASRTSKVYGDKKQAYLSSKGSWAMLFIAVGAQTLYALDYGGWIGALEYSSAVRGGYLDDSQLSRFSFLRPFGGFALLSSYSFFSLVFLNKQRRVTVWFGLSAAVLTSLYIVYSWQGRVNMVLYVGVFILAYAIHKGVRPFGFVVAAVAGVPIVIYTIHQISVLLDLKSRGQFESFVVTELAFVPNGFWVEYEQAPVQGFRYFYDMLVGPLFMLPDRFLVGRVENVADIHTSRVLGAPRGVSGVTSGQPVDILTIGYMQAGGIGIILWCAGFGALLHWIEKHVERIENSGTRAIVTAYVSLRLAGVALFYAHPAHIVKSNFAAIAIGLLVLCRASWKRRDLLRRVDEPCNARASSGSAG